MKKTSKNHPRAIEIERELNILRAELDLSLKLKDKKREKRILREYSDLMKERSALRTEEEKEESSKAMEDAVKFIITSAKDRRNSMI